MHSNGFKYHHGWWFLKWRLATKATCLIWLDWIKCPYVWSLNWWQWIKDGHNWPRKGHFLGIHGWITLHFMGELCLVCHRFGSYLGRSRHWSNYAWVLVGSCSLWALEDAMWIFSMMGSELVTYSLIRRFQDGLRCYPYHFECWK